MNQLPRHNQPIIPDQSLSRGFYTLLAVLGQRQVRRAGVSAVQGPGGFAVADYEAAGGHFSFFLLVFSWSMLGDGSWGGEIGCVVGNERMAYGDLMMWWW